MSIILSPNPYLQFIDQNNNLMVGGTLWSYKAGTSIPQVTYKDELATANTNPVVFDSAGIANVWLDDGLAYKYVIKRADGSVFATIDNINSTNTTIQIVVNTIPDLMALTVNAASSILATVLGYDSVNDGGGGQFLWNPSDSDPADGGMIISSNTFPAGKWIRIAPDSYIDVRWYNAKGDNSTNDTPAFSAASAFALANNWFLIAGDGNFVLESDPGLSVPIKLESGAILRWGSPSAYGLSINPIISDVLQHFNCQNGAWAIFNVAIQVIRPEWFGAKGDGVLTDNTPTTDDSQPIATALASSTEGCTMLFGGNRKYWTGPIAWKAGVNLRSDMATGNSTEAILQMNTVGDMITLTNGAIGGLKGFSLEEIILDGNGTAGNVVNVQCKGMTINKATLRNATFAGLVMGGGSDSGDNDVDGCKIYGVTTGIVCQDAAAGSITNNHVTAGNPLLIANIAQWNVEGNQLDGVQNYGMLSTNDTTGNGTLLGNSVIMDNTGFGLQINSTAPGGSLMVSNNIVTTTFSDSTGLKTVGWFDGLISNNWVKGFAVDYDVDSTIALQYVTPDYKFLPTDADSTLITVFQSGLVGINTADPTVSLDVAGDTYLRSNAHVGGDGSVEGSFTVGQHALITTYDDDSFAVINQSKLDVNAGDTILLSSIGGTVEPVNDSSSNLWDRKYLLRETAGADWSSVAIHDAVGQDATYINKTWLDREPTLGRFTWGNDDTQLMSLSDTSRQLCVGILSVGGLNFGSQNVRIGDATFINTTGMAAGTVNYQIINNVITMLVPATTDSHLDPTYQPIGGLGGQAIPTSQATTQTFPSLNIGDSTVITDMPNLSGKNYAPGQYVIFTPTTKDTWLTAGDPNFWWQKPYYRCLITAASGGSLTVQVVLNNGAGTIPNAWVLSDWPWFVDDLGEQVSVVFDPTQAITGVTFLPGRIAWGNGRGMVRTCVTAFLEQTPI